MFKQYNLANCKQLHSAIAKTVIVFVITEFSVINYNYLCNALFPLTTVHGNSIASCVHTETRYDFFYGL